MSSTESCSWYRIQKLGDMQPLDHRSQEGGPLDIRYEDDNAAAADDDDDDEDGDNNDNGKGGEDEDGTDNDDADDDEGPDMNPGDIMMDLDEEELSHFIPHRFEEDNNEDDNEDNAEDNDEDVIMMDQTGAPLKLRVNALRTLDDNEDSRVVDVHPSAGYVIRMDETLHNKWRTTFGDMISDSHNEDSDISQDSNPYQPFASELDWRIAQWAVKDGPGQNAFDRLLKIPGVRSYCLKLGQIYKLLI